MSNHHSKLHHTFTLIGAISIGCSFLFDSNVFWIFLGIGIVFIFIGFVIHAIRHHRRRSEEHCHVSHSDPCYVTPIQPTYPQTYQYQQMPAHAYPQPPQFPVSNLPYNSPYNNPQQQQQQGYGAAPYSAPAYNPYPAYNPEVSPS